ncbi:MAG: hypothetical protein MI673_03365, partial [Thiotrichales bacterium]|nr:hypothetical protein [Thiotrichales bacterium]
MLDDWSVTGANTVRASLYDTEGLGSASPYPFEGDKYFNEFNIYLNRADSPYDKWRAEVTGVVNISDEYRAADFGVVPERLSLVRENGLSDIPYKAEFGDMFTFFSTLTLQRSLKGFQLEMHPRSPVKGRD